MHDGGNETDDERDRAALLNTLFRFGLTLSILVFSKGKVEHGLIHIDKKTETMKHQRSSNRLCKFRNTSSR